MKRVLLSLAVMLALMTTVPGGSAQEGIYDVHLSVAIDMPGEPLTPGGSAWAIVQVASSCSLMPHGAPHPDQWSGVERISLTAKTTDGDLSVVLAETTLIFHREPLDCTAVGVQTYTDSVEAELFLDPAAAAHETMAVAVTAESSWAPGKEAIAEATLSTGSAGFLNATAPAVTLATDGTGSATITVTNEANMALSVRPDATLRTLLGPQPEIPPFSLGAGETRVLDVPLRVEDTVGSAGALEVRFDVASTDDPERGVVPIHLRIPVSVGDGPASLAMDVNEAPVPPLVPLLALLAAVVVAIRRS